jgi:hypothetical protein
MRAQIRRPASAPEHYSLPNKVGFPKEKAVPDQEPPFLRGTMRQKGLAFLQLY